jgi:hypothetical protein
MGYTMSQMVLERRGGERREHQMAVDEMIRDI